MQHILFIKRKRENELNKRHKICQNTNSNLIFCKINDNICVLGGMNYGKSYRKNRKYNN